MVSECANSKCAVPFRFMHAGRIFRFSFAVGERPHPGQDILWDANGIPMRTELFWLCGECVQKYSLEQGPTGEVILQPLTRSSSTTAN